LLLTLWLYTKAEELHSRNIKINWKKYEKVSLWKFYEKKVWHYGTRTLNNDAGQQDYFLK
jgi:hypothetical protein